MEFKEHLEQFLDSKEVTSLINALNDANQTSFRLNTLKVSKLSDIFQDIPFNPHPYVKNGYYYNKEQYPLGKSILFEAGAYYIQEPAAMLAVELLAPRPNEKVLDMCAAPGGKSLHAINLMNDQGLLVCNDIHPIRVQILSSNMEKYGVGQCIVLNDDSKRYKKHFIGFFDKIILDAPCSGSGMFRKNEFAKVDWSIEKVLNCQKIQLELLEDAYEMLAEQGKIMYSTCSYSIQEDEDVIHAFLKEHSDCKIVPIKMEKDFLPAIGLEGAIRLHPSHYNGEGHFIAMIQKMSPATANGPKMIKKRKPIHPMVYQFLDHLEFPYQKNEIININDYYHMIKDYPIELSGIKVIRYGLHLGKITNQRFEPNHALALSYKMTKLSKIELNQEEAIKYIFGETIEKQGSSDFQVVSYLGLPLGFVKHVQNTLKNHYPKGLRKKLEL